MQFVQLLLRNLELLHASKTESGLKQAPKRIRDVRGFGLIEVIVVVAIVSIVALGIATMMQDMFSQQRKAAQRGNLNSLKLRLEELLKNPTSWENTVAHANNNSSLACLRAGGVCNNGQTSLFDIVDSAGTVFYPSSTGTAGFRLDGSNCNSFSTGTPDPACPYRWEIRWTAACPGLPAPATCSLPDVDIEGTLVYSPGAAGVSTDFNPANYRINFRRGANTVLNHPITFRYVENDNSGEAGRCDTGAWVTRAMNQVTASGAAGASVDAGTGRMTIPTGSYTCRASAPGFKNGGNRIRLIRISGATFTTVESGVSVAAVSSGGSTVNTIETSFRIDSPLVMELQHTCTSRPSASSWPSLNDNFSKGVPVPDAVGNYTNTVYSTVSCIRTGS